MSSFGRIDQGSVGKGIQVTADGRPKAKVGGVTIDWSTVTAQASTDATWEENVVLKVGKKGLRYGQVIQKITASGKYGPYDPAASDGREAAPSRGLSFILNRTVFEDDRMSDHPEAIYGGDVFLDRIIQSGVATHTLALGPTLAELLAAFPEMHPVRD
jgi:hypothetical protein